MQMKTVTDVQIDLYGDTQHYMASAKQGDKATRYLRVQLMNNGNEFQIPDDVILIANIRKPDGKFCYNECERENNHVMVLLTNQALAVAGTAYCDIEMRDGSGNFILSSAVFTIEIEQSMRNENAIESSNEMTFIDSKFTELKTIQDKIEQMKSDVEETKTQVDATYESYSEALNVHAQNKDNPHEVTKEKIGLANVENTSDADKPVSIAQQAALDELYQQLTAYTRQKIADLINSAPESLDTLKEVADAIAAHKSVMDALDVAIGQKANQAEMDSMLGTKLDKTGNASNVKTTFTQADTRENLTTKEKLSVSLGKIMKWFADLANGAASTLLGSNLTANRALVADGNGKVAASSVTATELGYLAGTKSKVQDQIDALNTGLDLGNYDIVNNGGNLYDWTYTATKRCEVHITLKIPSGSSMAYVYVNDHLIMYAGYPWTPGCTTEYLYPISITLQKGDVIKFYNEINIQEQKINAYFVSIRS